MYYATAFSRTPKGRYAQSPAKVNRTKLLSVPSQLVSIGDIVTIDRGSIVIVDYKHCKWPTADNADAEFTVRSIMKGTWIELVSNGGSSVYVLTDVNKK